MSACGLAVFVKTPVFSAVKTRLWPDLGRARAEALYLSCAEAVASVVMQAARSGALTPYFAVAETSGAAHDHWAALPVIDQNEGGLGARMAHVYGALRERHHGALLVGADAPQLQAGVLEKAANWLDSQEPRLVLGRATDGGFWLFGGNTSLPAQAWQGVEYSRPDTADRFIAAFDGCGSWTQVQALSDLDCGSDIAAVYNQLQALPARTAEQEKVRVCLAAVLAAREASETPA